MRGVVRLDAYHWEPTFDRDPQMSVRRLYPGDLERALEQLQADQGIPLDHDEPREEGLDVVRVYFDTKHRGLAGELVPCTVYVQLAPIEPIPGPVAEVNRQIQAACLDHLEAVDTILETSKLAPVNLTWIKVRDYVTRAQFLDGRIRALGIDPT
jgi:hypothetical protein